MCQHSWEGMVKPAFLHFPHPYQRFWFSKSSVGLRRFISKVFHVLPLLLGGAPYSEGNCSQLFSYPCLQGVAPSGYFSQKSPLDLRYLYSMIWQSKVFPGTVSNLKAVNLSFSQIHFMFPRLVTLFSLPSSYILTGDQHIDQDSGQTLQSPAVKRASPLSPLPVWTAHHFSFFY